SHRHRADRVHVDQTHLLAPLPDVVGDHRAVGDRVGVGHREHCGVSAQSGCSRTGFDVFRVFAARFTQVSVQVDKPRQQDLPGGVDHVGVFWNLKSRTDVDDLPVIDQYVDAIALAVAAHTADQHAHAATSCAPTKTWNSTAIRTCTPLETCCSTADCDESATEDSISMPRSIGPGCSTTAWPGSSAWRRSESPSSTEYSRADGKKPPCIRSACTRSINTASAAGSSASRS